MFPLLLTSIHLSHTYFAGASSSSACTTVIGGAYSTAVGKEITVNQEYIFYCRLLIELPYLGLQSWSSIWRCKWSSQSFLCLSLSPSLSLFSPPPPLSSFFFFSLSYPFLPTHPPAQSSPTLLTFRLSNYLSSLLPFLLPDDLSVPLSLCLFIFLSLCLSACPSIPSHSLSLSSSFRQSVCVLFSQYVPSLRHPPQPTFSPPSCSSLRVRLLPFCCLLSSRPTLFISLPPNPLSPPSPTSMICIDV